jgi:K+-sensing histidine kinase KdpD
MEHLVAQVLEVTRIEDGRLELQREPVRLVDVVRAALTALPQTAYRSRIWAELAPDLPPIYGDPQRLEQVLINLLDNALKYSPPSGQVLIRAQPAGDAVRVQVLDEGMGIPEPERAAIFDKFQRASNVRHSHIPGNGLGLFICRSIIAAHGGEIAVEAPAGAGTCITFTLPLAAKGA